MVASAGVGAVRRGGVGACSPASRRGQALSHKGFAGVRFANLGAAGVPPAEPRLRAARPRPIPLLIKGEGICRLRFVLDFGYLTRFANPSFPSRSALH